MLPLVKVVRVLGMVLVLFTLFQGPIGDLGMVYADGEAWPTRDVVPEVGYTCSGVLLDPGHVVTARHCVSRIQDYAYAIQFPTRVVRADVACRSTYEVDFALLDLQEDYPAKVSVAFRPPVVGEYVTVAGYPHGQWTVMRSLVVVMLHDVYIPATDTRIPTMYLLTNPSKRGPGGFSGGGVFDDQRNLIGLICCGSSTSIGMIPIREGAKECPWP